VPNIFSEITKLGKIMLQGFINLGRQLAEIRREHSAAQRERKLIIKMLEEIRAEQLEQSATLRVHTQKLEELRSMLTPPLPVKFRIDIHHQSESEEGEPT
jgi:hypothetical protein